MIVDLVKRYNVLLVAILFLLISLYTITTGLRGPGSEHIVGKIVHYVATPIESAITAMVDGVRGVWTGYIYLVNLSEENSRLKKTVDVLTMENNILREKALLGERLSAYLDFKQTYPYRLTAARIIGKDSLRLYHTVIIDKGRDSGIERYMGAITSQGVYGKVIEVYPDSSKVMLLIDHNSAIDAIVQRSRVKGIVEGRGSEKPLLKYISKKADVVLGDLVITSGLGGVFPKGLPIGRIVEIKIDEGGFFKTVRLEPVVDIDRVEEIFVLTSRKGVEAKD